MSVNIKLVVVTRASADEGHYRCLCQIRDENDRVIGDATMTLPLPAEDFVITTAPGDDRPDGADK